MKYPSLLVLIVLSLSLTACKLDIDLNKRGDLISSTKRASHSLTTMKQALDRSKYRAKYAVKTYKIIYQTIDAKGKKVNASGLLAVPQKDYDQKSPLLVHLHDTLTKDTNAPSYLYQSTHKISKTASLGYIVIAPDYLGYGRSRHRTHPFLHAKTLASATIDMMKASKEWLKNHKVKFNRQVFLEGYSEGGFAAMATHREIEKHYSQLFTVSASAPAAGPYDLVSTFRNNLDNDKLASPVSIAFIIKAYNDIYNARLIDKAIKPSFKKIVDRYIVDGDYITNEINDLLGYKTTTFLKQDFVNRVRDYNETRLIPNLRKNNSYDWEPDAPIRLIHGEDDEVFPYANAVKATDKMIANGATDVELVDCDVSPFTAKHAICSVFAYDYTIDFFYGIADDL